MDTTLILGIALAGGAGAWLGWRLRGMRHLTERRVLEEIFTRKTRLAESEREFAVNNLDSAKLEGRTNLDRFQTAAAEVERLGHELAQARESIELGRESLAQTETRLAATLEVQAEKRAQAEAAMAERARALEARRRMETELEETRNLLTAELEEAREGLASRSREIGDLTIALAERTAEITRVQKAGHRQHFATSVCTFLAWNPSVECLEDA